MAEYTQTTTYRIDCPACGSSKVKKHGRQSGQQRYLCKECKKAFRANGKAPGQRMDAEMVGSAIRDFYTGKSYKQIAEGLADEYDIPEPSKTTVYEWVRDYTDLAVQEQDKHKAETGDHWVADETQVVVGGQKAWLWNVMDGKTRYILATHLTPDRDAKAARIVLRKALAASDKAPAYFFSDKLRSYQPALRDVLPTTKHYQSEGLTADINNNLSERLQGTFKDRIKTLRRMDNLETGQRYLDGWALTYNHFRGHESLHNDPPGKRAKSELPFTEWADVVKVGAAYPKVVDPDARLEMVEPVKRTELKPVDMKALPPSSAPAVKPSGVSRMPKARIPEPPTSPRRKAGKSPKNHPYFRLRERVGKSRKGRC